MHFVRELFVAISLNRGCEGDDPFMQKAVITDSIGIIAYWKSDTFDLSRDTLFFLHGLTADHIHILRI